MHETTGSRSLTNSKLCTNDEWIGHVNDLALALEICPADLVARGKLAALLEELHEWDGAFFHWRRILAYDPNNLEAWEGMARCRQGFPACTRGTDLERT